MSKGMKEKTIKAVLRKKIDDWLSTIEDENVRSIAAKGTIVTGGCIASMLLGEDVNDFDIYFKDYNTALAVAKYYVGRFKPKQRNGIPCRIYLADGFLTDLKETSHVVPAAQTDDPTHRIKIVIKSAGIASEEGTKKEYQYFEAMPEGEACGYVSEIMDIGDRGDAQDAYETLEQKALSSPAEDGKPRYRPVFMSTNAITLSDRVQLVIRFWGSPEEIHGNYDFVHCTNYWQSWDSTLVLKPTALQALLSRDLHYVGSKYPLCSIIRLRKFIARGWQVNAGQILKMCLQLSKLNLEDPATLEDQLTGVDQAYFLEIISKLKEKDSERVNAAYLVEIIDRMF